MYSYMLECEKRCGVFDAKFIEGGNQVLAASNLGLTLYDLQKEKLVTEIKDAHWEDVNSIALLGDVQSAQTVISGGDDGLAHLWDLRLM